MVCLLSEHEGCVCQVRGKATVEGTWPPLKKRAAQHMGVTRRTRPLGRRIQGRAMSPSQALIPHQDLSFSPLSGQSL